MINNSTYILLALLIFGNYVLFTFYNFFRNNSILQPNEFFDHMKRTDHLVPDYVSQIQVNYEKYTRGPTKNISKFPPLVDPNGDPVDFVVAVGATHCAVHMTAALVNKYFNPRYIFIMAKNPSHCPTIEKWDTNIICLDEKLILPHSFTSQVIRDMIKDKKDNDYFKPFNDEDVDSAYDRSGWYFLQYLNFGIGLYLKGISEHYVVWDSDIIPVENRRKFFTDEGKAIFYTQCSHGDPHISEGYHRSFKYLFKAPITHPPGQKHHVDNRRHSETWVAHQMIFKREYVRSMIRYIEFRHKIPKDSWMFLATSIVLSPRMKKYMHFGFADYDMYGSWVNQVYPETQHVILRSCNYYIRYSQTPEYAEGTCCPSVQSFEEMRSDPNMHYFLMEIHKKDEACSDGMNPYGVYEWPKEFEPILRE